MYKANNSMSSFSINSTPPDKDSPSLSSNQPTPDNTEAKFSYYKRPIRNTTPYKNITLNDAVNAIKGKKAKTATENLRAIDDVNEAKQFKANHFDYVTFSGTFTKRSIKSLIDYSGLIALDFDDVDVKEVKSKLLNQTEVDTVLLFVSPSGNGVKWIVPSTDVEEHDLVFKMYQRYCKEELGLQVDESGKDVARACFIPYDADVYSNCSYSWRKLEKYWGDPQLGTAGQSSTPSPHSNFTPFDGPNPFEDYNSSNDFIVLLEAHGWRQCEKHSDAIKFTRPGKKSGVSADFNLSMRVFYVFTDQTN
ncbi:MAG: BT4734/BF3469 family protein, partial [Dysgonamonadaceae bacterium]|nr:BT4734/BF3469 family protein [Dysgonamonadaceae bacterium]